MDSPATRSACVLAAVLCWSALPTPGRAQSVEIERQIDTELRYRRILPWIEEVIGSPPAVALSIVIALALGLVALVCYRYARKK